jgi:hypothetical protein
MNKAIAVVVLACSVFAFGQGGNSATEQKLTQLEKDLWEGWKTHNVEPFKKSMNDAIDVAGSGIANADQVAKEIGSTECTINGYSIDSPTFKWIDKNITLMAYHATQDATCGTERLPGAVWASSLWVKKGGEWKSVFHQETAATEKKE